MQKLHSSSAPSYIFHLKKAQLLNLLLHHAKLEFPEFHSLIKMAEIRDEYGNPIQLTDEHGNPVQLSDEYGNPMHLTGVVTTTVEPEKLAATDKETTDPVTGTAAPTGAGDHVQQQHEEYKRSTSSGSVSTR
jgi:hypothetical protein